MSESIQRQYQRHAILILAHRGPAQVQVLQRALSHPRLICLLHVDGRVSADQFLANGSVLLEPRRHCVWGGWGIVEATIDGLRAAIADPSVRTVSLVSGQDFPLLPPARLAEALDGCVAPWIDLGWGEPWREKRWNRHHNTEPRRILSQIERIRIRLRFRDRYPRRFPVGLEYRGGSTWWTLPRDRIEKLMRFISSRPDALSFFKSTFIADEYFLHTMLHSAGLSADAEGYRRFIVWENGDLHPRTLSTEDLEAALSSGALFARKFDLDVHPTVLEELMRRW